MLALEVADLVPDIGNDRIALGLDLGPLRRFVLLHREQIVPVGACSKLGPTFISRMIEVENGGIPLLVGAAGNENQRDAVGPCRVEQFSRRLDWPGAGLEDPLIEPTRPRRQHVASAVGDETKIVGEQIRPIGQRRLVNIEHQRGPLRAGCILLDELLRRIEHRRDVDIVVFLVIFEQQILDRADIERRRRGCGNVILHRSRASVRGGESEVWRQRRRRDEASADQKIPVSVCALHIQPCPHPPLAA